jgi:hypothetical protein
MAQAQEFLCRTACLSQSTLSAVDVGLPRPEGLRLNFGTQPLIFSQRLRLHPFLRIRANDEMGAQKIWVHRLHGPPLFDRPIVLAREIKDCAIVGCDNQ